MGYPFAWALSCDCNEMSQGILHITTFGGGTELCPTGIGEGVPVYGPKPSQSSNRPKCARPTFFYLVRPVIHPY